MNRTATKLLAGFAVIGLAALFSTSIGAAGSSAREQARESAASGAYTAYEARFKTSTVTADTVYQWSVRWLEAAKKTKGALSAAQDHLARMRALSTQVKSATAAGTASSADEKGAAYYVAEAEVWVVDAGGSP